MSRSSELFSRAAAYLPGGNTRASVFVPPYPPYARAGAGYELTDEDGHVVIDLDGNASVLVHGNGHPRVLETVADAMRRAQL